MGERQTKGTIKEIGHNFSQTILNALKINARGEIQDTTYDRLQANFVVKRKVLLTSE